MMDGSLFHSLRSFQVISVTKFPAFLGSNSRHESVSVDESILCMNVKSIVFNYFNNSNMMHGSIVKNNIFYFLSSKFKYSNRIYHRKKQRNY